MRSDMFKVIVERPRWGHSWAESPKLKKGKDKGFKQIGLKRHVATCARSRKALNENLAPLIRYLRAQRGRRWDDVFSDICAGLDTKSTVKQHVRDHIDDIVMRDISTGRHGEWMHEGRQIFHLEAWQWRRWPLFYVDPDDGILKDAAELKKRLT